jgi:hypothetical protein
MQETSISFDLKSPKAEETAKRLASCLEQELGDWQVQFQSHSSAASAPEGEKGDAIPILTLLVTVPPAILAAWDIAQRLKLAEKARRFLKVARERLKRDEQRMVTLHVPSKVPVPLDKAEPHDLVNAIAALAGKETQNNGNGA